MAAAVVVELAVAVVVAVVVEVEVEVAVAVDVSFGPPVPSKMSTIILITLSNKVIVRKKQLLLIILCYPPPPITTTTLLLPFVKLTPLPPLYPFHLILFVGSLLFRHQCASANTVKTPSPRQRTTTDAPTSPANALTPTPCNCRREQAERRK
jgi:hypothetical protein